MDFQTGDRIQARRGGTDEPIETGEGTIAAIAGTVVTMGTRPFDSAEGWTFELIERTVTLPTTLTEITATVRDLGTVRLMGKGTTWMNDLGEPVPASSILSFTVA
jgi:hypothetical protein